MRLSKDFKLMIIANAVFVFLYLGQTWGDYSALNQLSKLQVPISASYPLEIRIIGFYTYSTNMGVELTLFNFTLLIFIAAIIVNLYLAFRLQQAKVIHNNNNS
jgi:hypothetical protein